MKKIMVAFVLLSGITTGCATFQNTPAQERVYSRYEVCRVNYPGYQIVRVYSDGRFDFRPLDSGATAFVQCMTGKSDWIAR